MLAHPYGLSQMVDPRMRMQFVPTDDSKLKRQQHSQQPMMMMNPYDMVNVDQQRQLQTRMLLQQQLQSRTHQSLLQQHQQHQHVHHQQQQQQRRQPKAKPSKRVIAINLPQELHTIEAVTTTFYPYGEILLVRVLRPGKQLPFDLKQYQPKIPDLAKTVCAIIEFEAADAAKFAVQTLRYRTKELGFRLALLETGAEEDLYGPVAEPQLPMLKPGQAAPGLTDESGIELSGSGRSSGSDRDSDRHSDCASPKHNRKDRIRAPSSASESENERRVKLTEKWNPNVQAFIPGNFTTSPKKQPISTTATVAVNGNGRIITSVSISLSKPTKGRQTSKIALAPTKPESKSNGKSIQYSRDFLLSLRSSQKSLETPKVNITEDEFKRYTPPQRRHSHAQPTQQVQPAVHLGPRRNSHLRR